MPLMQAFDNNKNINVEEIWKKNEKQIGALAGAKSVGASERELKEY